MRICTIYCERRRIVVLVVGAFAACTILQFGLAASGLSMVYAGATSNAGKCTFAPLQPRKFQQVVASSYLSLMPCDTVILVATLIHAVNSRHLHALGGGSAALPVLTRVYHDGMAHYAVTLALRLWGAFSVIIPPTPYRLAPEVFVLAFTSIVASRFFLGLRKSISQMSRQALGLSETGIDTFLLSRVPPSRSLAWTTTTSTADVAPTPRSQPRVGSP